MGGNIGQYSQKHDFSFLMQISKQKQIVLEKRKRKKELRNDYGADRRI
jgi:hypothetical protein